MSGRASRTSADERVGRDVHREREPVARGVDVMVEMTPYDLTKGRINYRFK